MLLVLPFLVAMVPALTLAGRLWVAVAGVLVWGAAVGVQESTVKALVADLVPSPRLATAYGVFAAFERCASAPEVCADSSEANAAMTPNPRMTAARIMAS